MRPAWPSARSCSQARSPASDEPTTRTVPARSTTAAPPPKDAPGAPAGSGGIGAPLLAPDALEAGQQRVDARPSAPDAPIQLLDDLDGALEADLEHVDVHDAVVELGRGVPVRQLAHRHLACTRRDLVDRPTPSRARLARPTGAPPGRCAAPPPSSRRYRR